MNPENPEPWMSKAGIVACCVILLTCVALLIRIGPAGS